MRTKNFPNLPGNILKYWLMNFLAFAGKNIISTVVIILCVFTDGQGQQFFAGDGSALTASKWAPTCGGSYTSAFTSGNTANFCVVNGTGSGAGGITIGGINAQENFTYSSPSGTLATGGTVVTVSVSSGKTLNLAGLALSTAAGTGFIKSGAGTYVITSGGNFTGGFTLNAGTMIVGGVNAMGNGGSLTLNGGILSANSGTARDFTGKFSGGITIGGNVQIGEDNTVNASAGAGNLTFSNNVSLGSAVRTLTLGNNGVMTFGGVISNTASAGLTLTANANGGGRFDITNTANSFNGTLTISGGGEARFTDAGSFGNVNSTILIDGGNMSIPSGAVYTIASTHSIQLGAGGSTVINVTGAGGILTYNGAIVDKPATTGALKLAAGGTLVLGGACTYTGKTRINSGTLQLNKAGGGTLGASAGEIILNGGTLKVSSNQTLTDLTITSGTVTIDPGVTLTVNGTLTYTAGTLTDNGTLDIEGSMVANANTITGTGSLIVNGSISTTNAAGFNGSASATVSNTISSITLGSASTIDYASSALQTITAANYANLLSSGTGTRTFSSSGTIGISVSFSPGTGLYTIGTSTVNYNGTTGITAFPVPPVASGGNYYNLQITGAATHTMTSSLTVANDLTINGSGANLRVSNASPNTLTVNGNVNVQVGTLTGNGSGGTGLTIINISGNYTQSGGNVNVNNATNASGGTANFNVTGTFNLTGGNFNVITSSGGNTTVTVNGAVTVNTGGTNGINLETAGSSNGIAIFQTNSDAAFSGASSVLVDFGAGTVVGDEFRIKGNFSKSGSGNFYTTSSNTSGATGFVFNGTGTVGSPQTFSYSGTNSDYCSYQINSGTVVQMTTGVVMGAFNNPYSTFTVIGTIDCGLSVISGGVTTANSNNTGFTTAIGSTLMTKNTGGILGTITHVKTNFSVAGNYVFNSTAAVQNSVFKSSPQQMANLTISNPNGVILTGSATVTGTLAFTAGKITTSTNFVTLNTGATVTGAGTSTYVDGNVLWVFGTGNSTVDFPIGSSSAYAPVTLAINGVSGQVFVGGNTLTASEPNENAPVTNASGIDQTKKSGNYWTLAKTGSGSFTTYNVSFTIANTTNTGTPTSYVVRKFQSPSTWATTTLGIHTNSITQATGLTSFSEFEVGEPNTISAATDPSDGATCDGDNISFTSTSISSPTPSIQWYENAGSGFLPLSNGGIYSGVTTNTLTITGATLAMSTYKYRARFSNINGTSNSAQAELTVNTIPPNTTISVISGAGEACSGQVNLMTATATGPGLTYSWNTTTNPSEVLFSNSPTGPWSAGPFPTSGNTVYAKFGNVVGSGYNVCAHAINSCGSTVANKCDWIRGKVGTPGPINGSTVACPGHVKTYNCGASGGASVYTWTLSNSTTPITTNQGNNTGVQVTYPAGFTSGQLCVTASLSCGGSSTSAQRCITVSKIPAAPGAFTIGPSKICPGQAGVVFTVTASSFASGYDWTVPTGATITSSLPYGTSVNVDFPSAYTGAPPVCAYAKSACASSPGKCKTVGSYVPNQPGSMAGPTNGTCDTTLHYSVSPVSGADAGYTWTIPGSATNFSGQGSNVIQFDLNSPFTSGYVSVTANTSHCSPGTSTPRTITINGKPATPGTITPGSPSWCSGTTIGFSVTNPVAVPVPAYNWTVSNGTNMTGQGTNSITVTWGTTGVPSSGPVKVSASNTCGASGLRTQTFSTTCRESFDFARDNGLSVYPNPAYDMLTIDLTLEEQSQFSLVLRDISGRVIHSEDHDGAEGLNTFNMDISHFAKGIYMLEVNLTNSVRKTKLIIG